MNKKEYRMSIAMTEDMHEKLLALRSKPEYRSKSIGALIRMLIEKGMEESDNANPEEGREQAAND